MKQQTRIFLFAFVVIVILVMAFLGAFNSRKGFDWSTDYEPQSEEPYGTVVLSRLLKSYQPGHSLRMLTKAPDKEELQTNKANKPTYFFLGYKQFLSEEESASLLNFVRRGGTAMIVAENPSEFLIESLLNSIDTSLSYEAFVQRKSAYNAELHQAERAGLPAVHSSVFHKIPGIILARDYYYFQVDRQKLPARWLVLGQNKEQKAIWMSIPHGDGRFVLHLLPMAFTNYHIQRRSIRNHVAAVLGELPKADVIWDLYSRSPHNLPNEPATIQSPGRSPLSFLLEQEALRWSFYLLLGIAVVYLFFAARRRQRTIPIREPLRNFSLNFIRSIGRLYFLERKHEGLVRHQMRYLLSWLREKYRLSLSDFQEEQAELIHLRTGADLEVILRLAREYQRIKVYALPEDGDALQFHAILTQFYKSCK